jgi:multidrug transporter EmrE-like cation transporter
VKLLLAILPTVLLTAYSQLIVKWRVTQLAAAAEAPTGMLARALHYLSDLYVLSACVGSLLSAIAWFYVAERYPVSIAFPAYVGVLFAIVTTGGVLLLDETVTAPHLLGLGLILAGVAMVSRVT